MQEVEEKNKKSKLDDGAVGGRLLAVVQKYGNLLGEGGILILVEEL